MTSGSRLPTWKERENNKRRERRRRAIAAKIFAGLRVYGNYKLPKHCDNNEVLKALCNEAGWIVEEDGTTYRKGCKPVEVVRMESMGGSATGSPCSSTYQPSPNGSYNFSPTSSSIPSSSTSSLYASNIIPDPNSLIPWLKNLSSSGSSSSKFPHHLYMGGSSISAPVTPPLSSPTCGTPRLMDDQISKGQHYPFLPTSYCCSTPHSPGLQTPAADSGWVTPQEGASSPTFSLQVASLGLKPCSPADQKQTADVAMSDACHEFAFGGSSSMNMKGLVKAWEGERIHEECISDDLELTLGNPTTR
ncbi:BES1/BZR1 homolog protein 4-like [Cynara cardunculus var. scolymus]|uniref:Protein BZR1 homolog n=1 Tax=Cynara cardunculus var. scolymus TaxID=59895 RepID=A0A103XTX2_CYNCS|nr:BES1/BZR1 homolog protein 4-like [Cynara cardunculus var. scolymus]KVH96794.1 BZR1, transcriptional repressor [Cynara cardunculus var. scolymus]